MERKQPLRMCIVCREMIDKRGAFRIVRTPEGVIMPDPTNKANGRGAYVCRKPECIQGLKKTRALNKAFRQNVPDQVYDELIDALRAEES